MTTYDPDIFEGSIKAKHIAGGAVQDSHIHPSSLLYAILHFAALIVAFFANIWIVVPTGVAATDTTAIQAALDAASGKGPVWLLSGTFAINAPILIPSRTVLVMNPATVLLSSIASTGSPVDSPLRLALPVADGTAALLTSATVLGTRTLVVDTSIAAGKVVIFGDGGANTLQQATVISVSGVGPYTLTIDEPIRFTFAAGKSVIPYVLPTDIVVHGNGALLTGSGTNGIEMPKGRKVLVERMRIAGSFTNIVASWDLGCRDVEFRDLDVDATGAIVAISIESCVRAHLTRCKTRGETDPIGEGIWCTSAHGGVVRDCTATAHAVHGLLISGGDLDMLVDGGDFSHNASNGILLNGCTGVTVRGASIHHNGAGLLADAGTIAEIDGCHFVGAGPAGTWTQNYGIRAQGAGTVLQVRNVRTAYHSIDGIEVYTGATVLIDGWYSVSERYGALSMGLGKCVVANAYWAKSTTSGWYGAYTGDNGASDLAVRGTLIDVGGTACLGFSINRAGDVLRVADVTTIGTGNTGIKVNGNVACTVWRGANVDLASCTTQVSYGSGATQHLTTQS